MGQMITRRRLLALAGALGAGAIPRSSPAATVTRNVFTCGVDVSILFDVITLGLSGTVTEEIDRGGRRYRVAMVGEGSGVETRTSAAGIIRDGRFMPAETLSFHRVRGREHRLAITYDYERGLVEYHGISHTFFLGRRRQLDDVLRLSPGQKVDDLISASLNFAAGKLDIEPDGTLRTAVVRRSRPENEGPDDVSPSGYRAEIVPLRFRPVPDPSTGQLTALVDLTRFSSWARADRPARVTFGTSRRLESIQSSLILGTKLAVRLTPAT